MWYTPPMRTEVREARIKAGLTQDGLARLAGVQRKQVIALETGKNVTLATVERIAAKLPDLQHLDLGGMTLRLGTKSDESRKALTQAIDLLQGLLDRLGGPIRPPQRPRSSMVVSAARMAELEELVAAIARGTEPATPIASAPEDQNAGGGSAQGSEPDADGSDETD
jgi:DNA-binding XRE family transcriptional regulator